MTEAGGAWKLLAVRLGSIAGLTVLVWFFVRAISGVDAFPPNTVWSTLVLLPVNILCLVLLRHRYLAQGRTLRDALGVQRGRVRRDLLWGLLWLAVLNIPFAVVISGMVFAMYGSGAPAAFETIFFNEASIVPMPSVVALVLAIVTIVPFMLINAPTEELLFRGYALDGLTSRFGPGAAIALTSLLFGVQHVLFAPSVPGMLVYFVAFTVWGLVAAIIVRRQGRLLPVVIAHWIVNIMMSMPGIVLPILQLVGLVPAE